MKTALITGASRGIGAATALALAREGYAVALNYRYSEESARRLLRQLVEAGHTAALFRADVSDPDAVRGMAAAVEETLGGICLLVNNAGVSATGLLTELADEELQHLWEINVGGALHCARAVLPGMLARGGGCIVNVSSIWGQAGASCEVAYSTTKAALIGFTKALAKEVGPANIRVNAVAPGVIETDMNEHLTEEALAQLANETPLGRLGRSAEVAAAIAWLASDAAAFITGQVLTVDGGIL